MKGILIWGRGVWAEVKTAEDTVEKGVGGGRVRWFYGGFSFW